MDTMRALSALVLAAFAHIPLTAQQTPNAVVHGVMRNVKATTVLVGYYASAFDDIFSQTTIDSAKIGKDGRYTITLTLRHPVEFYVKIGNDFVTYQKYIAPGDTVVVDCTRRDSVTEIVIGGNHEAHNDLLADVDAKFSSGKAFEEFQNAYQTMEPDQYAALADRRLSEQLRFIGEGFKAGTHSDAFRRFIVSKVYYRWAYDRLQFVWKYSRAHKEQGGAAKWSGYYAFLDTMALNADADGAPGYVHFIHEYLRNIYRRWADSIKASGGTVDRAAENTDNLRLAARRLRGRALDVAHLWCIESQLEYVQQAASADATKYAEMIARVNKDFDELVQRFGAEASDREYAAMLNRELSFRLSLMPGRPAPDFTLNDLQGRPITLSKLKGRPVYLDVWATNCAPCVQEMKKDVPRLQERFGDSVAFVYVSFDPSEKAWRKFVEASRVKGVHVRDAAGLSSSLAQRYRIAAIPRHILLDASGRIVSADAPGAGDIADAISALLARGR